MGSGSDLDSRWMEKGPARLPSGGGNSFLTVREVGEILRLSPRSVHRLIDDGCIEAFQIGKPGSAVRVVAASVDRYVLKQIERFQLDRGTCGTCGA